MIKNINNHLKKVIALAVLFTARAEATISYTDAWDISQGSFITSNSSIGYGSSGNMLGGNYIDPTYPIEAGMTIFSDGYSPGFTHWIEWQALNEVNLTGYNLTIADDAPSGNRGISQFSLFYKLNETDNWILIDTQNISQHPYLSTPLTSYEISNTFVEIDAKFFRAEFVQYSNLAPRIEELDAISVPEMSTSMLIIPLVFVGFRRKRI
jgi:hypothetical protein